MFSNKNKPRYNVLIKIGNQEIDQTTRTQFLELIIDLNFTALVGLNKLCMCNTTSNCLGILSKVNAIK